jgi:hypothetical protein
MFKPLFTPSKFPAYYVRNLAAPFARCEFRPILPKIGGRRSRGSHDMRQLEHTFDSAQPPSPLLLCVRAVLSYVCSYYLRGLIMVGLRQPL